MKQHLTNMKTCFVMLLAVGLALALSVVQAEDTNGYDKLVDEATELLGAGKPKEAVVKAKSAILFEGKLPDAYLVSALAYRRLGEKEKALEYLDRALERASEGLRAKYQQMRKDIASEEPLADAPLEGDVLQRYESLLAKLGKTDVALGTYRVRVLREFMTESAEFLSTYSDQTKIWVLRAACAVELDYPSAGWLAGKSLKERGLENSSDENVRKVMAAVGRRGWLGEKQPWRDWAKWTMEQARTAAEEGDAEAQTALGTWYELGRSGLTKDEAEAVKWYRKAAEQGYEHAQDRLGVCCARGTGLGAADPVEATKWFRKSALAGYPNAQNNFGLHLESGRGVAKDANEAIKWYRKAAEQDHAQGKGNFERLSGTVARVEPKPTAPKPAEPVMTAAAFMAQNALRSEVILVGGRLQYEILKAGSGSIPSAGMVAEVEFSSSLVNGKIIDSTYENGKPKRFTVGTGEVIPGLDQALLLMPQGSKWRIFIPPSLGYGSEGNAVGSVPPDSVLIYELVLRSVAGPAEAPKAQESVTGASTQQSAARFSNEREKVSAAYGKMAAIKRTSKDSCLYEKADLSLLSANFSENDLISGLNRASKGLFDGSVLKRSSRILLLPIRTELSAAGLSVNHIESCILDVSRKEFGTKFLIFTDSERNGLIRELALNDKSHLAADYFLKVEVKTLQKPGNLRLFITLNLVDSMTGEIVWDQLLLRRGKD